ncbi:MAG: TonB-dependent receptor [Alphaproteobacteria bacterium]|nr:TonB-dependent receptor [Alphaproteobacteria bacterium]
MKNLLKMRLIAGVTSVIAATGQNASAQTVIIGSQQQIDEIVVMGTRLPKPALSTSVPKDIDGQPFADTGDYLRNIPGVTSGRMGGHALEPVIRGQSRSQLNIINDGAFLEGAGPNRMDTSVAFADIDTADVVIVQRGYQSVQNGPGGSGGTIIVKHYAPIFEQGQNFKGRFDGAYESNASVWSGAGNISAHAHNFYLRLNSHFKDAGNYDDGSGNKVRTAFRSYGGSAEAGYSDDATQASIGISQEELRNSLFPGAGMDSPQGSATIIRAKLHHDFDGDGIVKYVKMDIYRSHAYHVMDNFSLRKRMMMFRRAELDAYTTGGKVVADLQIRGTDVSVGLDIKNLNHNGLRRGNNMDRTNLAAIQSVLIPDATIRDIGLFAEAVMALSDDLTLKAGLRFDNVKSQADKADMKTALAMTGMMPMSANMLYKNYYGVTATPRTENNFGGLLRIEYDITSQSALSLGISRSTRSANTVERYIASIMGNITMPSGVVVNQSWIGNPALLAEKHSQIDMGIGIRKADWNILLSAYYDNVNNYIFRDHARGQKNILLNNNALIYRNIDASIWGFDIETSVDLTKDLKVSGNISYTRGQNKTLDLPLAQIPPLSYDLTIAYGKDIWSVGSRLHGALKQTRVDANLLTGSGRDAGKTAGYTVVDIFASVEIINNTRIRFGVSNLFNRLYANHLNRESMNDATAVRVNEPGRSFYCRIQAEF